MKNYGLFDGCLVLALDKRKEHWLELIEQGKKVGLEIEPYICGDGSDTTLTYNQIDVVNPDVSQFRYGVNGLKQHHINAFTAQQACIQLAKDRGWKSLLFLEDDALILSRFTHIISEIEKNPPHPNSWLMIYLGWWVGSEYDDFNENIEEEYKNTKEVKLELITRDVGGLHGVIIKEEIYDLLLALSPIDPIDSQLCALIDYVPRLMCCPKAIHVKNLFSFTEGVTFVRRDLC